MHKEISRAINNHILFVIIQINIIYVLTWKLISKGYI